MSLISQVSDKEASSAVRYLDPDPQNESGINEPCTATLRFSRQVKVSVVILSISASLYCTMLRYLPAVGRFLN